MVLFNIGSIYHKLGQMKGDFWKQTHIGIPETDTESNDAVVLGFLVAQFIGEVCCLSMNNYCFKERFSLGRNEEKMF